MTLEAGMDFTLPQARGRQRIGEKPTLRRRLRGPESHPNPCATMTSCRGVKVMSMKRVPGWKDHGVVDEAHRFAMGRAIGPRQLGQEPEDLGRVIFLQASSPRTI
jgi:hypothetical protein